MTNPELSSHGEWDDTWKQQHYAHKVVRAALAPKEQGEASVASIYTPATGNQLEDVAFEEHYPTWGYSLAMEHGGLNDGEVQNTAIFRIFPGGLTEPVYVTKQEPNATFEVMALSGRGLCVIYQKMPNNRDMVRYIEMGPTQPAVTIVPGMAYSYLNMTGEDLVLHDTACPAFKAGDDAPMFTSLLPDKANVPQPKEGYSACIVATRDGTRTLEVPNEFYEPIYRQLAARQG